GLFFFHYLETPEPFTLSLHDALPICLICAGAFSFQLQGVAPAAAFYPPVPLLVGVGAIDGLDDIATGVDDRIAILVGLLAVYLRDRKSTRLNSSHVKISYAVFCLKKK